MLSVLIPVYNVNLHPLISELQTQLNGCQIDYEILIEDDASSDRSVRHHNAMLGDLDHIRYMEHETNLGRSKTRNHLADCAQYPFLLFLDADARMKKATFVADYLEFVDKQQENDTPMAVLGGVAYRNTLPEKEQKLRYLYGVRREVHPAKKRTLTPYHNFTPFNLLISKSVFETCRFDESLTTYGYEDTFFGLELEKAGIPVYHIDNEMFHDGLDGNRDFLAKITDSVHNLHQLYADGKVDDGFVRQSRLLQTWQKHSRSWYFALFFNVMRLLKQPFFNLILKHNCLTALDLYKVFLFHKLQISAPNSPE